MQIAAIRTPSTVTSPQPVSKTDVEDVIQEVVERQNRKNIIIAGLPEAPDRTAKNCSIYSDKTPKQLEYYKKRKKELTDRTNRGETNLKIKYYNDVPKIVSLN